MKSPVLNRALFTLALALPLVGRGAEPALALFDREIKPMLDEYCYGCHGGGIAKGGVTLDEFTSDKELRDHKLWLRALKNVRSGIMPPADEPHLPSAEATKLVEWIKRQAFELDPKKPDPGRVTVRRLNRTEYRNTVRDLTGVDFDTKFAFPADDSGHGFDNIGDVLTVSPMLLEKYLDTAQTIIAASVPPGPTTVAEVAVAGREFTGTPRARVVAESVAIKVPAPSPAPTATPAAAIAATTSAPSAATTSVPVAAVIASSSAPASANVAAASGVAPSTTAAPMTAPAPVPVVVVDRPAPIIAGSAVELSYYTPITVTAKHTVAHAGAYQLVLDLRAVERFVDNQFDYNQCRLTLKADGESVFTREFSREGGKPLEYTVNREWAAGEHEIAIEIEPIGADRPQLRQLRLRVNAVTVRGPMAKEFWVTPKDYGRFFPRPVPADLAGRRTYAGEILQRFATRAFRRPADTSTVQRLVELAESHFTQPDATFEGGVAQSMVAVLASPRFIFREEETEPLKPGQAHPFVDEYALASRLSYFFWSTMPDEELFRLAREHRLRAELTAQVTRMLKDPRSDELVKNFTGQWLQGRDISTVQIDAEAVFLREHPPTKELRNARATIRRINDIPEARRSPEDTAALEAARRQRNEAAKLNPPQLNGRLREAMQEETEMSFAHILKQDRPLTELIDSNYTFLNEELAKHYGVPGVTGRAMRLVTLPPDSPRGGVLTQGTVLAVTSNPTRTSPVKRGVFILDAILGTPPAPPPPDIPPLEDAASPEKLREMTLRETLALHASNAMCASCHSRMDPLGLALENFNALGQWRSQEMNHPIDSAGKLITGEAFADIRELKRILATNHRDDFYRNVSEKLLTYALGRGIEYSDTDTLDQLVARLDAANGRPSALISGIVESAAFQQRRRATPTPVATAALTSAQSPVPSTP